MQSAQSVPKSHALNAAPGPPSSQIPSEDVWHVSEQAGAWGGAGGYDGDRRDAVTIIGLQALLPLPHCTDHSRGPIGGWRSGE
eukprot:7097197-Prymnesium_polylepis.2